jgi:hypothetical protein
LAGLAGVCLLLPAAALCQTSRPFYMAVSAVQSYPGQVPSYQNSSATFPFQAIAADADVVTVFPEFLGVPFYLFSTTTAPPANDPWVVQLKSLATKVRRLGKPVLLQTVLTRDRMVPRAIVVNGALTVDAKWAPGCYDFSDAGNAATGDAYVRYVNWLAKLFNPKYYDFMIEINLYYESCGGASASWNSLVGIEQRAYQTVKAVNSNIIAFPSFTLETIYAHSLTGFDQQHYAALAPLTRDRFGVAAYPYGLRRADGTFASPYDLPTDYFSRVRNMNPGEAKMIVTETGWNSVSLAVGTPGNCYPQFLYSDTSYQSAYMQFLLFHAYSDAFEAVTWWSDRDLISSSAMNACYPYSTAPGYVECGGDIWCVAVNGARQDANGWPPAFSEVVFKAFGTMGLRQYDGTAKPTALSLWQGFVKLPVVH